MKVTSHRTGGYRVWMAAGCLLAAAAISGFSLFAQAPAGGAGAGQPGAAPPTAEESTELPLEPGAGVAAGPGAGNSANPGDAPPPGFGAPPPGGLPGASGTAPPSASGFGAPGGGAPSTGGIVGQGGFPGKGPARGRGAGMMGAGGGSMMGGMMMPGAGGQMSLPPEMALDQKIKSALKAYRTHAAEPEVRAELVKVINNHVAEQFKIRQERREAEIKSIEVELARVKQLHESRVANQEAIIASRVKELLSTADGLGWDLPDDDSPSAGASGGFGSSAPRP